MTLAALEETLRIYRFAPEPTRAIPVLRLLTRPLAEIERLGVDARDMLAAALGPDHAVEIVTSTAKAGSGARPDLDLESRALAISASSRSADEIAARFRSASPPIIGRVLDGRFLLDLRAIEDAASLVPRFA
jgi:L-seryl-tRNA(Ser) seleniumtransferase